MLRSLARRPFRAASSDALQTSERGAGTVSTFAGAVVFLAFLLLATHVLVGLYATSVVTTSALDAAQTVARSSNRQSMVASADARLHNRVGGLKHVSTNWEITDERVGLHVTASRPSILPPALLKSTNLTSIDRTVWVRSEKLR